MLVFLKSGGEIISFDEVQCKPSRYLPIRVAATRVTHSNISSSFSFVLPTVVLDNRFSSSKADGSCWIAPVRICWDELKTGVGKIAVIFPVYREFLCSGDKCCIFRSVETVANSIADEALAESSRSPQTTHL